MLVLLGGHIVRCADAGGCQIYFLVKHFRYSEISQFGLTVQDEYVGGLEISVENSFVVHVENGQGYLCSPIDYLFLVQLSPPM